MYRRLQRPTVREILKENEQDITLDITKLFTNQDIVEAFQTYSYRIISLTFIKCC